MQKNNFNQKKMKKNKIKIRIPQEKVGKKKKEIEMN